MAEYLWNFERIRVELEKRVTNSDYYGGMVSEDDAELLLYEMRTEYEEELEIKDTVISAFWQEILKLHYDIAEAEQEIKILKLEKMALTKG